MKSKNVTAIGFGNWKMINAGEWLTIFGSMAASVGILLSICNRDWYWTKDKSSAKTMGDMKDILESVGK